VELKFYAMGRRRRVSTFVDKERSTLICCLTLCPRRRTVGASPHSVELQFHALTANAVKKRPQCTLRRGRF